MKRALLVMATGFVCLVANQTKAAVSTYTFEGLNIAPLQGQDNWKFNGQGGPNTAGTVTTPGGSGNPSARVEQTTAAVALFSRINDGSFSIPSLVGATTAAFEFDARVAPGASSAGFGVGHDANSDTLVTTTEVGWRYGTFNNGTGGAFQAPTLADVPFSSAPTSISTNDWLRLRLNVNFVASTYSYSYKDLTTGETAFSLVPGRQNVSFTIGGLPVSLWDAMLIDVRTNAQLDNLLVDNNAQVPEPSALLLLGMGGLTFWIRRRVLMNGRKQKESVMKRLNRSACGVGCLMLVVGLAGVLSPRPVEATIATYDFETRTLGTLNGQDNWAFYGVSPNQIQVAAPTGTGNTSTKDALGSSGRELLTRLNNGGFSFPTIPTSGIVDFQADLRSGAVSGSAFQGFGLMSGGTFAFRFYTYGSPQQFEFIRNSGPTLTVAFPGRIGALDWLRVRLEADLGANTASLYYQDLTLGDTSFSLVTGPFTFLSGGTPAPGTWNTMFLDVSNLGQADNLMVDVVVQAPEPNIVLLLGAGALLVRLVGSRRKA